MSLRRIIATVVVTALAVTFIGCAGNGKLMIDETYSELKPVKQLELPDQLENNLVIKIANVADQSASYKNRLELFVNDRMIEPNWLVSNVQDTYTYEMKLKPGYYKVKAYYYAYVGWGDEKFRIEAQDLVRITPVTQTVLSCAIEKKPNGVPVNDKMYFKVKSDSLIAPAKAEKKVIIEPAEPKSSAPEIAKPVVPKSKPKKAVRRRPPERYW